MGTQLSRLCKIFFCLGITCITVLKIGGKKFFGLLNLAGSAKFSKGEGNTIRLGGTNCAKPLGAFSLG